MIIQLKVGILVPMSEEIDILCQKMDSPQVKKLGGKTFYIGKISGIDCVLALSGIGKVASAVTAAYLIECFKISHLLVTGIAGGLLPSMQIGDIFLAHESMQHDMNCHPLFPKHEIPLTGKSRFASEDALIQIAKKACHAFRDGAYRRFLSEELCQLFQPEKIRFYEGLLLSGDQFIGSHEHQAQLLLDLPEAFCVEMEGGAVGQVCHETNIPFVVIRSISDAANSHSEDQFARFIPEAAGKYTYGLVVLFLEEMSEWRGILP